MLTQFVALATEHLTTAGRGVVERRLQQRRLADARLALDEHRPTPAGGQFVQPASQRGGLHVSPDEHSRVYRGAPGRGGQEAT